MLKAFFSPYTLIFKEPGGTSRGVMTKHKVWYIFISDSEVHGRIGVGECAPLPGLSIDNMHLFEAKLQEVCENIELYISRPELLFSFPAIRFGVEMATLDYKNGGIRNWFPSDFTNGNAAIQINGLIWMGSEKEMLRRIAQKLDEGFSCLKMKIGAIDFSKELGLLRKLRANFSVRELELRVDANGAFSPEDAFDKLNLLAAFDIHSIEQPIKAGNWEQMASLCANTPIPIALDEELIGVNSTEERSRLLDTIAPQYVILKPTLVGGFASSNEWIHLSERRMIKWWVTSALESNIGLNAIAQWTFLKQNPLPQGLGTGQVFMNNIPSQLGLAGELLYLNPNMPLPNDVTFIINNAE